jgi:hypothetical protein
MKYNFPVNGMKAYGGGTGVMEHVPNHGRRDDERLAWRLHHFTPGETSPGTSIQ